MPRGISTHVNVDYEFRLHDGRWQRRVRGERQWLTLHVEHVDPGLRRHIREDGSVFIPTNRWTWT